jgi:hypothetical protein
MASAMRFSLYGRNRFAEGPKIGLLLYAIYKCQNEIFSWALKNSSRENWFSTTYGTPQFLFSTAARASFAYSVLSGERGQVVLSSLVRRFTVEPFKEYETNPFIGSKSPYL